MTSVPKPRGSAAGFATIALVAALPAAAQQPDTTVLAPITVSATRGDLPLELLPFTLTTVPSDRVGRARPNWGLDEALVSVPGVFVANRYNFSLDQRVSIRGFGARSAFAVRGVKVLVDGIPQTLPDGQGQLTNVDLGTVERIEVLSGAASALHGNASGGVISVWTGTPAPVRATWDVRLSAGSFDRDLDRTWTRAQAAAAVRVGAGAARFSASRLSYAGERNYSEADVRNYGARLTLPLPRRWTFLGSVDLGDQPLTENPGALNATELANNRDAAAPGNLAQQARKDVTQLQGGVTLRRDFAAGGSLAFTFFGLTRDLINPQTFAWIEIDRSVGGVRVALSRPLGSGARAPHLSTGVDIQGQHDDRVNYGNAGGTRDTTRTLDQVERVREMGAFAQVTVPLSTRVAATAGARYDNVGFSVSDRLITATNPDDSGERPMSAPSGSLGLTWRARADAVLYANAATVFETPTTTELANRPTGAGGFNDSLGPQRAWMLEAGARWSAASGAARATLAVFRADVRDALVPYEVPSAPQRRFFRNAGRSVHAGVEAGLEARASDWLTLRGSYAWSRFRYVDYDLVTPVDTVALDGRAIPGVPEHRGSLTAELRPRASGVWGDLEAVLTSSVLVDDTLATRAEGWTQLNVRVGWEGTIGATRWRPFAALQNVFNTHYVGSVVINAAGGRYYEPAPGRNLYLGLEIGGGR